MTENQSWAVALKIKAAPNESLARAPLPFLKNEPNSRHCRPT
jgi:hypothetical protein